jgi:hypothetical protein
MVAYLTYNLAEAQVIAGRLQAEGIPAMVHQAAGAQAFGITVGILGEIKVLVRPGDYRQAMLILAEDDEIGELPDSFDYITYHFEDDADDE